MGILKSIAVTPRQLQPMELISEAEIRVEEGILGDARGANKTRQVSVLFEEDWLAACEALQAALPWESRRANLLVNGANNPKTVGAKISIGDVILEVTEETKPCQLMERVKPGLRQALEPAWRGGVCCRVLRGGCIALERDQVKWTPVNRPIARQTVMPNVNLGHDHVSMKNDHALGNRVEIDLPA